MSLRDTIYDREQTPISYNQIMEILGKHGVRPKFHMSADLKGVPGDSAVFGANDCAVILVNLKYGASKFAYWVAIIKKSDHYEFFDSLGHSLANIVTHDMSGSRALLMWSQNKRVSSNKVKLQRHNSHVSTCGCHVAVRLLHKSKDHTQYARWLTRGFIEADLSVSMLCYLDLLKIPEQNSRKIKGKTLVY